MRPYWPPGLQFKVEFVNVVQSPAIAIIMLSVNELFLGVVLLFTLFHPGFTFPNCKHELHTTLLIQVRYRYKKHSKRKQQVQPFSVFKATVLKKRVKKSLPHSDEHKWKCTITYLCAYVERKYDGQQKWYICTKQIVPFKLSAELLARRMSVESSFSADCGC